MRKLPSPIEKLFDDLSDSITATLLLIDISTKELARLEATIDLMKAVHDKHLAAFNHGLEKPPRDDHIRHYADALPLVDSQRDSGFPFLHGLAAIAVWSELEAYVEDIVTELLLTLPELWDVEAVHKVKAPVSEFIHLNSRERSEWMVQALQRTRAPGRRVGVGHFEPLLDAVDMGGPVDTEVTRCLAEFSAVRNVLVHRRGRADARYMDACPNPTVQLGEVLEINEAMLYRFAAAALIYASEILRRIRTKFGDETTDLDDFKVRLLSLVGREIRTAKTAHSNRPPAG